MLPESVIFNCRIIFTDSMNVEEIREYCLNKKGVTEGFPFGETSLVLKVAGKMFCLIRLDGPPAISLKNTPEKNLELREHYPAITSAYHMNKQHWNTVDIDGTVLPGLVRQLIDDSYNLVVGGLTGKQKEALQQM